MVSLEIKTGQRVGRNNRRALRRMYVGDRIYALGGLMEGGPGLAIECGAMRVAYYALRADLVCKRWFDGVLMKSFYFLLLFLLVIFWGWYV